MTRESKPPTDNKPDTNFAQAETLDALDQPGGRFARERTPQVGRDVSPYPALPEASPWSSDPVPAEPVLDVNAMEPAPECDDVLDGCEVWVCDIEIRVGDIFCACGRAVRARDVKLAADGGARFVCGGCGVTVLRLERDARR